ncbi:MAG: heme o synthase [Bacteroidota bacterium]
MQSNRTTYTLLVREQLLTRVRAYVQLMKFRLSSLVVFSAVFGYFMAPNITGFDPVTVVLLALGGFLVTGASNALNQVIEAEYDAQMSRTQKRPMVIGAISPTEAVVFALIMAAAGVAILGACFSGIIPALLGIIALLLYAFVYTPLKRVSSLAVLVGAFPGAMPPLIGWAAATGSLDWGGWVLFLILFFWQFPHFWAIAWILDDDYTKAGFKMLPGAGGRTPHTASTVLIYTFLLVPVSYLPFQAGMVGGVSLIVTILSGLAFTGAAWMLLRNLDKKAASRLMFGSFIYLPVVQITMLIDKF